MVYVSVDTLRELRAELMNAKERIVELEASQHLAVATFESQRHAENQELLEELSSNFAQLHEAMVQQAEKTRILDQVVSQNQRMVQKVNENVQACEQLGLHLHNAQLTTSVIKQPMATPSPKPRIPLEERIQQQREIANSELESKLRSQVFDSSSRLSK